jgi:ribulose bisphosphate carboxylase small subunit
MGSSSYLQAIKPDTGKIKKLIESSLLFDWVIRIEYDRGKSEHSRWSQWDQTFFALRAAESVIAALKSCYSMNPDCIIRINAEKVRPQTCMYFTVYNPHYLHTEASLESQLSGLRYTGTRNHASMAPCSAIEK